jgi:hypothetical protein
MVVEGKDRRMRARKMRFGGGAEKSVRREARVENPNEFWIH